MANDGADALEVSASEAGPIALLVTDVVMPRMRGSELAERLRIERPGLRVLYLSGYTDDTQLRGELPPGTDFLGKPFSAELLATRVRALLDNPL
jgi:DNA-binding response OmpR family regulator